MQCTGLSITYVLKTHLHTVNFIQWKLLPMQALVTNKQAKNPAPESQIVPIWQSQMFPCKLRPVSSRQLLLRNIKWKHFWFEEVAEQKELHLTMTLRATTAQSSSFSLCSSSFLRGLGRTIMLCSLSIFAAGPVCTRKGRVTSINS